MDLRGSACSLSTGTTAVKLSILYLSHVQWHSSNKGGTRGHNLLLSRYSLVFLPCVRERCITGNSPRERTKFLIISFFQSASYYVLLYHRISWVGRDSQGSLKFNSGACIGQPRESHHVPETVVQIRFELSGLVL